MKKLPLKVKTTAWIKCITTAGLELYVKVSNEFLFPRALQEPDALRRYMLHMVRIRENIESAVLVTKEEYIRQEEKLWILS